MAARVTSAERATLDLDVATHAPADPSSVALLADALDGELERTHRVKVREVALDCIDTLPLTDDDLADLDARNGLFLGAHRFALEGAGEVVVVAGDLRVPCRVASPAGLLATKCHAARYRRRDEKIVSDVFDLERLIGGCPAVAMAQELAVWPNLARLVQDGLARTLIRDSTKHAGRMARAAGALARVTEERLAVAGETMCALLHEALKDA